MIPITARFGTLKTGSTVAAVCRASCSRPSRTLARSASCCSRCSRSVATGCSGRPIRRLPDADFVSPTDALVSLLLGGRWDTHGQTQLEFLTSQGLRPEHTFLDVGCGCLRAGRHLIDYLEPNNYYGVDANHSLVKAGYDVELTDMQRRRVPASHLRANERFDGDFGVKFDFAIAQSVFSHVTLNQIRL